jgi:hypothetical protein
MLGSSSLGATVYTRHGLRVLELGDLAGEERAELADLAIDIRPSS